MLLTCSNPAQRRFIIRMWVAASLSSFFSLFAALVFRFMHPAPVVAYIVVILPALPILGALGATGIYLGEEKDEYQRHLLVQCLLGGTGCTLAATTVWGYLQDFARAPHLDPIWIYPIFWLFVGLSMPVVKQRYR